MGIKDGSSLVNHYTTVYTAVLHYVYPSASGLSF